MSAKNDENILQRYSDLLLACNENREYFVKRRTEVDRKLGQCLERLAGDVETTRNVVNRISCFAHEYDFDPTVPGNGYRSVLHVANTCIDHILDLCRGLSKHRSAILSYKSWYLREIEAYTTLLSSINSCIKYVETMHEYGEPCNLFSSGLSATELFAQAGLVNQLSFYGRCLGFQYCASMQRALIVISTAMAGFSESYFSKSNLIWRLLQFAWKGGKYTLQPESRAKRIVSIAQNADIHFCKSFWQLAELEIFQKFSTLPAASVDVNRVISIPPEPLTLKQMVTNTIVNIPIPTSHFGPAPISARLFSMKRRKGMIGEFGHKSEHPPSENLIIHCHGGGYIATSSKSHSVYLLDWAKALDTPILSIDYSLAPEAPYPRALEEIFYTYCWSLNNCHLLGWTGKRIIMIGDSAGANLIFSTTLKCIQFGIRIADGLFAAYCPFLVTETLSPGRILSLMDPLLPFGFLINCLRSYVAPSLTVQEQNAIIAQQREEIVKAAQVMKATQNLESHEKKLKNGTTNHDDSDWYVPKTIAPELTSKNIQDHSQQTHRQLRSDTESDAAFLKNPTDEFDFKFPTDPLVSPYLASDEDLKQFPSIKLLSLEMDSCLDDSVMFAKKMRRLNVPVTLDIIKGLPHGFLNLVRTGKEADEGALLCQKRIGELLEGQ